VDSMCVAGSLLCRRYSGMPKSRPSGAYTMPLTLYVDAQFISPYAMSAYVALREKDLDFELQTVDLAKAHNRTAHFAAASLTQRVPTLVDGDFSLSESSAITEYVDEMFPGQHLYPESLRLRARARQVQAWLRSDLMPIRAERSTEVVFYGRAGAVLTRAAVDASEKLFLLADRLLEPGTDHLFGTWSIADVDLSLMLNRLVLHGDPVPGRLADYAARQFERPSVASWVALDRPALESA
jgi:glutathione S-transferase